MLVIFVLFALAVIVAVAANTRGRNAAGWFVLSLFITPILTGLLLLALPKLEAPTYTVLDTERRHKIAKYIILSPVLLLAAWMLIAFLGGLLGVVG